MNIRKEKNLSAHEILEKYSMPEPNTGCWIWIGYFDYAGYGQLTFRSKSNKAHRFSYQHLVGDIPKGKFVCHHCDNPSCINPHHLFLGTRQDNIDDMVHKQRHCFGEQSKRSKLTSIDIAIIRETWIKFGNGSQKNICNYFKISQSNVSLIVNHLTWGHLS